MALWNKTDREESKPTWLNPAQKINCVRTVRGWELPLDGTSLGGQLMGLNGYTGVTATTPHMELLVCLPLDPSAAGVTDANYATRTTATGGTSTDTPNYAPYFTCPFSGDSATAGGFDNNGLSSAATQASGTGSGVYALNKYGVSSLWYPGGVTAYVKVVANDSNFTNSLVFSIGATNDFGARGTLYSGTNLLTATNVPVGVYEAFFGPTTAHINNIAVFRIAKAGATSNAGPYNMSLNVYDGSLTGSSNFRVSFGATFA